MDAQVDVSLRKIVSDLQEAFRAHPSAVLDRSILVAQSLRTMLACDPEDPLPYLQNCTACEPPLDLSAWDGDIRRFGVSLGHARPMFAQKWLMPFLNEVRQDDVTECLAGPRGWILRLNPELACSICGYKGAMLELIHGDVRIGSVESGPNGYPVSAIVPPETDSPEVTSVLE